MVLLKEAAFPMRLRLPAGGSGHPAAPLCLCGRPRGAVYLRFRARILRLKRAEDEVWQMSRFLELCPPLSLSHASSPGQAGRDPVRSRDLHVRSFTGSRCRRPQLLLFLSLGAATGQSLCVKRVPQQMLLELHFYNTKN